MPTPNIVVVSAVQNNRTRRAPDNGSDNNADYPRVGGANQDGVNVMDRRNLNTFGWTDRLNDDLLECYDTSMTPVRDGYMARLHALWCEKHPELSHFSHQRLRNHAENLRIRGYVSGAHTQPQPEQAGNRRRVAILRPTTARHPMEEEQCLRTRRNINIQVSLKPKDLAELDDELRGDFSEESDLWTINCSVYNAARALADVNRKTKPTVDHKTKRRMHQLSTKIGWARQYASRIQCVIDYITSGRNFTAKVRQFARDLRIQHHTLNKSKLLTIRQHIVDRIRILSDAWRSLERRERWVRENEQFFSDPSRLFQDPPVTVDHTPKPEDVEAFWREVYEVQHPLEENTKNINSFKELCNALITPEEECPPITAEEVKNALRGMKNYSAPGPDGIKTFWWKKFPSTHQHLARIFTSYLKSEEPIPEWLVEGRTVLLPKMGDLVDPKNYRPITCLNTLYKIFTAILNDRIVRTIGPVWREIYEQRGSKKGVAGCRENLLIDRCVCKDAATYQRYLSMAWIDYRKAFDSTSHRLIICLLESLKVHPHIVRCIERLMPLWKTRFTISSGKHRVTTNTVTFQRGVFQGDTMSPLLFCLTLLPLSLALRHSEGYFCGKPGNRKHKVTHVFYMDDLKIYAKNKEKLHLALGIVEKYTQEIGMEFGLEKCAKVCLKKGKLNGIPEDPELVDRSVIRHLGAGENYTYLGVPQSRIQDVTSIKDTLRCRYKRLIRRIWSSELSARNKVSATNMLAVPVVLYSFGVVPWTKDELRSLDIGTRKVLHMNKSMHLKSSVPRLYISRRQGGRGILNLECLHNRIILGTAHIVANGRDPLLKMVREHEEVGKGAFLYKAAEEAAKTLGLDFNIRGEQNASNLIHLEYSLLKTRIKKAQEKNFREQLLDKKMHGIFHRNVEEQSMSYELTFAFLKSPGLKSGTEGFILACQDGVISTLAYRRHILSQNIPDDSCRACHAHPEHLGHILSSCPTHAGTTYIQRHNAALRVLYYHLCHSYGISPNTAPLNAPKEIESIVENEKCRIYWNFIFSTIVSVAHSRPDIVLLDFEKRTMFVIEFSAPSDKNIIAKENEKKERYRDLIRELRRLYPEYSVKLIVLIIGALGGAKLSLVNSLKSIPACQQNAETLAGKMQKAVVLGSLRVLRVHETFAGSSC